MPEYGSALCSGIVVSNSYCFLQPPLFQLSTSDPDSVQSQLHRSEGLKYCNHMRLCRVDEVIVFNRMCRQHGFAEIC